MRYKRNTKNSVRMLSDETSGMKTIVATVQELVAYESKLSEDGYFTAAEIYLDLNLAQEERDAQIKEIQDTFDRYLKQFPHSR